MRVGWVGFHEEGLPALEALLQRGVVVGVMTLRPDKAAKRSAAADVPSLCARFQMPVDEVAHVNDADALARLAAWRADVIFVIGWSQILSPEALETARIGTIGAHASLLPHNRGSAPINWAIIRGEQETGNSLMWLDAAVDNGDLIAQRSFPISPYDTCASLYQRVAETNRDMILETLDALEAGQVPRRPQGLTDEPLLPRRRPADGRIDWQQDALEIYRFVRALTRPYPGAFSRMDGTKWLVWQAQHLPLSQDMGVAPGTVIGPLHAPVDAACGILVACGTGALGILEIQAKDGTLLKGRALADSYREGMRFHDDRSP